MENVLSSGCAAINVEKVCYLCESDRVCVEGREVKTFGILAECGDKVLDYIKDVDTDEKLVNTLCEKLNSCSVSIEHFRDVVYDFVVSVY